ncbi:hypothetical protein [Bradyrhizobium sp. LeoA1S1]
MCTADSRNSTRKRRAAFVALARLTSVEVLHDHETSQQRAATTDPILSAIATHRAAVTAYSEALDRYIAAERLEANDPRRVQFEREFDAVGDAETAACWDLVNVRPSTRDGTLELLEYVAARRNWPGQEWHAGLLANLAAAINAHFGRSA